MNTRTGEYHRFNEVGNLMWIELQKSHDKNVVLDRLVDQIDASRETLSSALDRFIAQLLSLGFIEEQKE
ncbi:PqqD family protein [Seinonella peptonophila]|uniref:PqqD family protein n=1 Tax=Seinonella peptonophila TaxID=112248 RepID=UPI0015874CA1|nr:PqqD family protein [Seinonella peptonophila]